MTEYETNVNAKFKMQRYYDVGNAVQSGHWDALRWWAYSHLEDPPPLLVVNAVRVDASLLVSAHNIYSLELVL